MNSSLYSVPTCDRECKTERCNNNYFGEVKCDTVNSNNPNQDWGRWSTFPT